ncbi:MAG: MGMT family protein [Oscillospiraceae bacterium]|jgi:methylated-DNA-protein-cysteine methyltransferase-like protein|nr:MGMT family protein [Oscillospiraceae bacterium]
MTAFYRAVYDVVRRIPSGRVASYGQVAALAGRFGAGRAVGHALHRNPWPGVVPCHRVVFQDGALTSAFAFGGAHIQRSLLEAEDVVFTPDGRVDMARHRWRPAGEAPDA